MSLLDILLGRQAQTTEQPITFAPLQPVNQPQMAPQQVNAPLLKQIMVNDQGGLMPQGDINQFYQNGRNGVYPQINPTEQITNTDAVQPQVVNMGLNATPEKNGILQDLLSGFHDNLHNSFNPNNLRPVADKSLANKLGEALGTATRFADSPLGRTAITAGIVGASGGTPLQSVAYGATAGVKNQQLKAQDQLYRDQLKENGVDTSDINGYIGPDEYDKITNANYKNAYKQYLMDKTANVAKSKTITLGELMNVSPEYKKYIMSQYDFSDGQNADLLEQEMPVDMLKNTGWLPKEVNVNSHVSGSTSKEIHKSGGTNNTNNIVYSGGTHSTKTNYGAKNPEPIKEGTTAVNKKTGERIIYKGNKWQKL